MSNIKFKFIWDKLHNIPLFNYIFNNKQLKNDTIIYSCFKYPNQKDNIKKDTINIYYTGERFLDDLNSNITIGFLPSNISYINNKFKILNIKDVVTNEYKIEIINVNNGYKNRKLTSIIFPLISKDNKIYIQIRDQEREHIEYLIHKKIIPSNIFIQSSLTLLKSYIHLYTDLNNKWIKYSQLINLDNLYKLKPNFCCFIVSNPNCWQRNIFYEMLSNKRKVDSLGKLYNNINFIVPSRHNKDEYYKLISTYRFMITFENNSLAWYHTEKIYNAFQSYTIPIYWGDILINDTYNINSFIHIKTFENKEQQIIEFNNIIDNIIHIDNNPNLYLNLFKSRPVISPEKEDNRLSTNIKYLIDFE